MFVFLMKVLFVANRIPYPPYRGDKLKIYNLAKQLCKANELHLITFYVSDEELNYKDELLKVFSSVKLIKQAKLTSIFWCFMGIFSQIPFQVLYFKNLKFAKNLKLLLKNNRYDAIHVQHLRMAQYFKNQAWSKMSILDLPDAFSLYWKRRIDKSKNQFDRFFAKIEYKRLLSYEQRMLDFKLNLVCSKEDMHYLQSVHKIKNIALLPNGVDVNTFAFSTVSFISNRILFTGNMDYAPNIDGAVYFVQEILPLIRKKMPKVEFVIAGQRPVSKIQELATESIKVTGFIANLNEMYASACVVVSPLRIGAGTQNKVLESMSMGVPVVCSQIGFEGLQIANGEGVFMETTAQGFANRVLDILADPVLRERMGKQASALILAKFSWETIAQTLTHYFESK